MTEATSRREVLPPLPKQAAAFRKLVIAAKSAAQRESLYIRIKAEFPDYSSIFRGKLPASKQKRLFEARLLEFVRNPTPSHNRYIPIDASQEYACRDLVHARCKLAPKAFRRFLKSKHRAVRALGAEVLAWTGSDRLAIPVARLIRGTDLRVAKSAMNGAALAAFHGYAENHFRATAYRAILPLVCGDRAVGQSRDAEEALLEAPEAMHRLRPGEALELLGSRRCIHCANRAIRAVLIGLHILRERRPQDFTGIDPLLLWPVFEAAANRRPRLPRATDYEQVIGLSLTLAADRDPIRTRQEATRILRQAKPDSHLLIHSARQALRRCKKVPEALPTLHWMENNPGRLPRKAEHVLRAYQLADHVNSDGFPLFFHNLGVHARDALSGLKQLGLSRLASSMEEAMRVFRPLPRTYAQWQRDFNSLTPGQAQALGALSRWFDRGTGTIFGAVERYMSRHSTLFRPSPERSGRP